MISVPLTHIITSAYPIRDTMILRNKIKHDFFVEEPLADRDAIQFVFYFRIYDGEDLANPISLFMILNKNVANVIDS